MNYDLTKGHMVETKETVHHAAVKGTPEVGHYETITEYPNGGKDVRWVVEVPAVIAVTEYDEEKTIQTYVPYTDEELAEIAARDSLPTLEDRTAALESAVLGILMGGAL